MPASENLDNNELMQCTRMLFDHLVDAGDVSPVIGASDIDKFRKLLRSELV